MDPWADPDYIRDEIEADPPTVPLAEQYRLAARMVEIFDSEPDHDFAARVLEERGMMYEDR